MKVTQESRPVRRRILFATWAVCALLIGLHTLALRDYADLLAHRGLRGAREADTPLQLVLPAGHADAQMWVRHALAGEAAGQWRVRESRVDNAPAGREVHWSSSVAWLLRLGRRVEEGFSANTGPRALERAVIWLNAPVLLGLLVAISAWGASRAGAGAGVILACGMIGHIRFYDGFLPTNVDHHGLINTALLGVLLGLAGMGVGWWQATPAGRIRLLPASPDEARRSADVSAACGAVGLWLSAASVVPLLALAGAAGLAVAWWHGPAARREGAHFEPAVWRRWGRVGAGLSLAFYLLEYAPAHFGLRLEVNHPLYALAWWGGSELIAAVAHRRLGLPGSPPSRRVMAAALLALAAAPIVLLYGGRTVFLVADPVVGGLWRHVVEGMSLPMVARSHGLQLVAYDVAAAFLLVPLLILWRKQPAAPALTTGALTMVTAVTAGLGFLQNRWFQSASAAQIVLLLVFLAGRPARTAGRQWRRILLCSGLCFLLPLAVRIVQERSENRRGAVNARDLVQPLYRDVAATLRRDQPQGAIVVLASPDASAGIGYFGGFSSLGTLYWENVDGLRAAGEIFTTSSDATARDLVRRHGVTHVVLISRGNFIGEYFQLLRPGRPLAEAQTTFGYRLGTGLNLPAWLQPVPYDIPPDLAAASPVVRLFRVARE